MALKINHTALAHARSLIAQGKINRGEWKWDEAAHSPEQLQKICLAEDPSATEGTKQRFKYPFGTEDEVNAKAVSSAEGYAKTNGETELHAELVKLSEEIVKRKEHGAKSVEASTVYCSVQDLLGNMGTAQGAPTLPAEITIAKLGRNTAIATNGKEVTFELTQQHFDSAIRYQQLLKSRNPDLDLVIDCNHATHDPEADPSAYGWMKRFTQVGDALRSVVDWTVLGAQSLKNRLLRYFSPTMVFNFKDLESGEMFPFVITDGALTNQPQLETLPAVMAAKRLVEIGSGDPTNENNGGIEMKELVKLLCTWLGKPETATEDELKTAFATKTTEVGQLVTAKKVLADLGFDDGTTIEQAKATVIMAKKSGETAYDLAARLQKIETETTDRKATELVDGAVSQGKIFPSQREDMLVLAKKDLAGMTLFFAKSPVVAPLVHVETGDQKPGKIVTEVAKEIAKNLQIDPQKMVAP